MTLRKKQYNTLTLSATGTSDWIPVEPKIKPFELNVTVDVAAGSSLTYTVEYTVDPLAEPTSTVPEISLPEMIDLGGTLSKAVIAPVTGIRLNITVFASGSADLKVRQSGVLE